jgi:hypothetical protein
MTIRIELTPEEEARLRARAAERGTAPEQLAAEMVRAQLPPARDTNRADEELLPVVDEQGVFHPERLELIHRYFVRTSAGLPSLPDEALTREALYQDHD